MSDYDFSKYFQQIQQSQDPNLLNSLQFDSPGAIDRANGAGPSEMVSLEKFKREKIAELQQKAADPAIQRLNEFTATGQPASDMAFANINQLSPDGGIPSDFNQGLLSQKEQSNPLVQKALSDFKIKRGNIDLTANVLSSPNPQNVAQLIQTNPEHFASNMKNASAMLAGPDTETPALRDFTSQTYDLFSKSPDLNDFIKGSGTLLSKTKADPVKAAGLVEHLSKNFKEQKDAKAAQLSDYPTFYRGFQAEHPDLEGGKLDAAATREWHRMKVAEGSAIGQNRIPTLSIVSGTPDVVFDRRTGTIKQANNPQNIDVSARREDQRQSLAEATQRGGSQSAQINAANDMYQRNLPEIIALRKKVQDKGLLPGSRFKDANKFNQWLSMKTSDPDVAELQGKIKLQSDALQKTIGGGQGGEWSFKVAADLLDGSLAPKAFERRMQSHGKDIATLAKARREFGKTPVADQPDRQQAPAIGTVKGGYRFNGGNPADKNSWSRVGG